MNTIFVQIASYRDPQLIPTIESLVANSNHPENLKIVVCWQHGPDESIKKFEKYNFEILESYDVNDEIIHEVELNKASIKLIDLHYLETHGACWARNKIQQHYNDEKYTLQLDSHHRFVPEWDTKVIKVLEDARSKDVPKPLLTAYLPSFNPENDPAERINLPWKMNFDRFIPEGAVFFRPATIDEWNEIDAPVHARFYSGHFAFADGSFAEEVQHDPDYFFHGEEISIAARAFTHGYDLFYPHIVIGYHEYTRKGRIKVWDDHSTQQKNKGKITEDWRERNVKCHKRNRILFGMDGEDKNQIDFGKYGFGTVRSLKDYEWYSGLSFKLRGVTQTVLDDEYPVMPWKEYSSDEEFEKLITKSNDIRICFHTSELGEVLDDYDFWYVGTHDKDYKEIYRKDYTEEEVKECLKSNWIDQRFIFLSETDKIPDTYTILPHSKSKGWGERIIKHIETQ